MERASAADASAARPSTRWAWARWFLAGVVWLVLTVAIPIVAQTADLVRVQGFPLGFFLVAQAAPIALAALGLWLALWDRGVSGVAGAECDRLEGTALAMLVLSPALVLFALLRVETDGFDGLMLGHGVVSGLVLWLLLSALPVRRDAAQVSSGQASSGQADAPPATPVGIALLLTAALVPLAATHIYGAARLFESFDPFGLEGFEPVAVVALLALAVALAVPTRVIVVLIAAGFAALLAAVIAIVVLLLPAAAPEGAVGLPGLALPQMGYGPALAELSRLERDLTVAGLADPVTTRQFARPWSSYSMTNGILFALAASLATATMMAAIAAGARVSRAELPPIDTTPRRAHQVRGMHWLLGLVLVAVLSVPALAVSLKAYHYGAVEDGVSRTAPPAWLETALGKGWAQMCEPPPPNIRLKTVGQTTDLSAAAAPPVESPDWWLEEEAADATLAPSLSAAPSGSAAATPVPADDALVARYLVANNLCRGPLPRLAVGDISLVPLAIPALATAMTGSAPLALQTVEAVIFVSLVLGLVGLLTLLRTVNAPAGRSRWLLAGLVFPVLLCVLALGLVHALPHLWVGPFELPVWTLALLSGGVAPAFAILVGMRDRDSILLGAVPIATGVIGFVIALAYLVLTSEMTVFMSTVMPQFSDAPSWKLEDLESLVAACLYGTPDACTAARALSRETANIAGLRAEAVGVLIGGAALFFGWLMLQNVRQFRRRSRGG